MSPSDLKDMLDTVRSHGLFVTFVVLPALALGAFLAFAYVKSLALRVYDLFEKTETHASQFETTIEEIRQAVARFDKGFGKHLEDTERFNNGHLRQNCRIDACPHLPKFFDRLDVIAEETGNFAEAAKISREQTGELIQILMRRLDDLFVQQIVLLRRNGCDK